MLKLALPIVARWICVATFISVVSGAHALALAAPAAPVPLLAINFDELAQGALPRGVVVRSQFRHPDVVPGVSGMAWRTDGFSSYAEAAVEMDATSGFTLSAWVALESFPSDLEVPVWKLSPSSIIQQAFHDAGYDVYIDTFGRWGFRVATSDGWVRIQSPESFPLYRWTHVAVTVDPSSGAVVLYQDGKPVGAVRKTPGTSVLHASVPLRLATPPAEVRMLEFIVNRLNGAFDDVAVYPRSLTQHEVRALYDSVASGVPDAESSLGVSEKRFASDTLRPRVHPMPPANWTNEPHGFERRDGVWHLFYQRTPNGPYKTQMHWGHMTSFDLVNWQHSRDALWPQLQSEEFGFDMKGIWSGDVILDGDKALAFYTSVNHGERLADSNPGIAMAVSDDPQLRDWRKLGPILNTKNVLDFRDPYLWREGDVWHMIIGAALSTGGGLDYYTLRASEKGARWQRQSRFTNVGYRFMDTGSVIWEMPVFERLADDVYILVANPIGGKVTKYGEPSTRAVYWTGTWTGGVFKPFFKRPKMLDLVPGHLAPTVARADDGSLRAIGIIDERRSPGAQQRAGWANTFSLPRVWRLMEDGHTLGQSPAPELRALRAEPRVDREYIVDTTPSPIVRGLHAFEMLLEFEAAGLPGAFDIDVLASEDGREFTRLRFDPLQGSVMFDKAHSTLSKDGEGPQILSAIYPAEAFGAIRKLRVFVDGSTIEVFVNDAAAYAVRSYPSLAASTGVQLSVQGAGHVAVNVQVWPLKAAN